MHVLAKCFSQCVILAVPRLLISAALTAWGTFHVMAPHYEGWDFFLCATFGAIASATNLGAAVTLLKGRGASVALTMQVTGEGL